MRDRLWSVALLAAIVAFTAFVVAPHQAATAPAAAIDPSGVQRGPVPPTLQLPAGLAGVDLEWMPERLANEAAPPSLRDVIVVRGVPGVASADGPAVISWTEAGVMYWLISPTRSRSDLIRIAADLRP